MKLTGKIEKRDLEGGITELVADGGKRYAISSAPAELGRAAGKRVEIDGEVDEGAFGFAMTGPALKVRSFRVL